MSGLLCESAFLPATRCKPFYSSLGPCCPWIQSPVSAKTNCRKSAAGTLRKHSLHTCPSKAPQRSARAWQPPHQAAGAPCQGLTFEKRATLPNVMRLVICAWFPLSCPNKSCWHCLRLLWDFFGMNAVEVCTLCALTLLTFSWSSTAAL